MKRRIRAKIGNTGHSRKKFQEIVDEEIGEVWKERYGKNLLGERFRRKSTSNSR